MLFICYFFPPPQQAFAKNKHPILAAGTEAAFSIPAGCRGGMDVVRRAVGWGSDGAGVIWDRGGTGLGRSCDGTAGTALINAAT